MFNLVKFCTFLYFLNSIHAQEYFYQDIDDDFYQNVVNQYQERKEIDPYVLNSTPEGIFELNEDAEIFTSFLDEGAGYKNTYGLFTVEKDESGGYERTSVEKFEIFSNASKIGSGGRLRMGDTYKSAIYQEGTNFGFYIESNGYRRKRSSHTFYSYTPFNQDDVKHTILTYDYDQDKLAVGFEDLYGGGDRDYNDLIVSVFTNPVTELRHSSSNTGVANISGQQTLGVATGMVTMSVASFGRIVVSDEIILYPEEFGKERNVDFIGKGDLYIESNAGVLVTGVLTNLSNGLVDLPMSYKIDGQVGSFYTPSSSVHNRIHEISVNTYIQDVTLIESGEFIGSLSLTMSIY
jgi:hypothetical protein